MSRIQRLVALTGLTLLGLAAISPAHAQTAYAISNGGDTLVRFDIATPGSLVTVGTLSGDVTRLDGIDFRQSNGRLYGYDAASNHIVTVDPTTAFTTFASAPTPGANSLSVGLDFDPTTDRLQLSTTSNQNEQVNPDTGATMVGGSLAYAPGDPVFVNNPFANPFVIEAAFTNNDTDPTTGTKLYYIDYVADTLVTTDDPASGVLTTVGNLGVDTSASVGFDIVTGPGGVNTAYALLEVGFTPSLYEINLNTGEARFLNDLTGDPNVFFPYSLAIAPAATAVPEPGTVGLLAGLVTLPLIGGGRKMALSLFLKRRRK